MTLILISLNPPPYGQRALHHRTSQDDNACVTDFRDFITFNYQLSQSAAFYSCDFCGVAPCVCECFFCSRLFLTLFGPTRVRCICTASAGASGFASFPLHGKLKHLSPICFLSGDYYELHLIPFSCCARKSSAQSTPVRWQQPSHRSITHVREKHYPNLGQNQIHHIHPVKISTIARLSLGRINRHPGQHLQKTHLRRNQAKRRSRAAISGFIRAFPDMRSNGRNCTSVDRAVAA